MNKILILLLTISCPSKILADEICYNREQREKLAKGIVDLQKCLIEVSEKDRLINEKLIIFDATNGPSFWQEPSFIVGGLVVSFSVGALTTYFLVKK